MRKLALIALAIVFCVAVAKDALAVQTNGKVVSVDMAGPTMVIKDDSGATLTLAITSKTDIQRGMRDIDLADFKPGTAVVVRYNVKEGKNVARYIGYVSSCLQRFAPSSSKKEK